MRSRGIRQPLREDLLAATGRIAKESPRSQPHQHRDAIPWQVGEFPLIVAVSATGRLVAKGADRLAAGGANDQDNGIQLELQTMQLKLGSIGQQRALTHPIDRRTSEQCSVPKLLVRREYHQKCGRTLPVLKQAELIALLYLENDLVAQGFTPGRLAVLELLASQASISLQNAVLYEDLQHENAERKFAEASLRKSRQLLQDIIDASTAVVYVKDCQGRYLLVNRRFEELFHVTGEGIAGRTDHDLFPKERADAFRSFDQRVLVAGKAMESEELVPQDDALHTYISIKAPLRDETGALYGVCGISTDFTERKRLEQQLRESQKIEAIGRLAGGIAHDFNNLITVINGYSQLLRTALRNDSQLREKVDEIYKAGEQASALTQQLLAFGRRQRVQPKVLDLNELLGQMAKMLRRVVSEDIEFSFVPNSQAARVCCDPGQIQQVIMNLVVNARDAMPRGGKLVVSTENTNVSGDAGWRCAVPAGNYVQLIVTDTGFGMDAETKSHIFEPFFTTKEVGKGTGIGLATVHGIVQQANGYIYLESEAGKGTSFHIYFPRVEEAAGMLSFPVPSVAPRQLRGSESILLVEDQEGLRKLCVEILKKQGYNVLTAGNGREALLTAETYHGRIDLMITDMIMPQLGGRELAEQLPASHPETKILFMSGYADRSCQLDQVSFQYSYIEKPFPPEALLKKIREILESARDDSAA